MLLKSGGFTGIAESFNSVAGRFHTWPKYSKSPSSSISLEDKDNIKGFTTFIGHLLKYLCSSSP